jgi:hypothetical protein
MQRRGRPRSGALGGTARQGIGTRRDSGFAHPLASNGLEDVSTSPGWRAPVPARLGRRDRPCPVPTDGLAPNGLKNVTT